MLVVVYKQISIRDYKLWYVTATIIKDRRFAYICIFITIFIHQTYHIIYYDMRVTIIIYALWPCARSDVKYGILFDFFF